MTQPAAAPLPRPPRRRRKEARPDEILDAALDLFAAKGFAATRPDEIAARAGIAKGTLYLYFPSKDALFQAVVRRTVGANLGTFEAWVDGFEGASADLLRDLLARIARLFSTTAVGRMPRLVIAEATAFPDLARFWAAEVVSRGLALVERVVARGVARGEFAPDAAGAAFVVVAPLLMMTIWNTSIGPAAGRMLDPEQIAAQAARMLLDGLRRREDTP